MKHKAILGKLSAIAVVLALSGGMAFAAATAYDTASNYSASGAWSTSPANLGSGFGAWTFTSNDGGGSAPYAGTYLDSYGNGTVASGGYDWGFYANGASNAFVTVNRAFTTGGGSASLVDQTFSFAFSSPGIGGTGQSVVMDIGSAFSLGYAGGGADNMTLSVDGGTANAIGVNFAAMSAGINVALSVTGPVNSATEGYSLVISPFAGGSPIYSGSGTFDSSAYDTASFSLTLNNTSNDQFLNDLNIAAVPEPSSMVMLGFAGLSALLAFRRRK